MKPIGYFGLNPNHPFLEGFTQAYGEDLAGMSHQARFRLIAALALSLAGEEKALKAYQHSESLSSHEKTAIIQALIR